jgi:predicted ATPase/DNA-binding SARP family transcriptional activator
MNPPCRIELLGGLRVRQGDRVISRFQTQKTGALLAYLALHAGRSFPRETMAELLWPDGDPSAIRNRLNQAISSLRRQLHPPGCEPGYVLQADHLSLQVNPHTVVTDVAEFEEALQAAEESEDNATQHLRQAVDLYQGEFLDGYYEEWALLERVRLSDQYYEALSHLIRSYAQTGRISEAIEVAIRRLAIDPSDERAHRALMRLYLAAGRPRSALAQYQQLVRALALDDDVPSERAERLRQEAMSQLGGEEADFDVQPETHEPPVMTESVTVASHRGLPRYLTKLWGRDEELATILSLWEQQQRLTTLTGFSGMGKTRLAVEAAWQGDRFFGDRIAFVSMAEHAPDDSIVGTAAQLITGHPTDDPLGVIARWTHGHASLLVLDNLERADDTVVAELADMLVHLPNVYVLVTSWHPLDIDGEHVLPVRPLPIPGEADRLKDLAKNPAIALFVDRAQAARQDFQLTERTAAAIQELCQRLEGVPLALELAASWARTLTASQMVEQVTAHYDRLTSRRKDLAPRHRSMRAVVDGSFLMVPESLREAFVKLSVFVGGWDHAAATQVCYGIDVYELLRVVEEFGLVNSTPTERGLRFSMLETVRAFCRDQMNPDLAAEASNAHADYYAALVERAVRREGMTGLHLIAEDNANCLAGLRHLIDSGRFEEAARFGAGLALYWEATGRVREGAGLLDAIRANETELPVLVRGLLILRQARLAWRLGKYELARTTNDEAIQIFTQEDDLEYLSQARLQEALEAHRSSDFARAEQILRENVELVRSLDIPANEARNLLALGNTLVEQRRWDEAARVYEDTLTLARKIGIPYLIAMPLANLGNLDLLQSKPASGKPLIEEARAIFETHRFHVYEQDCRRMIARAERMLGDPGASLEACRKLLADPIDDVTMIWGALVEAAYALREMGKLETTARIMGVVESMWATTATCVFGVESDEYQRVREAVKSDLGAEPFETAVTVGRRLDTQSWSRLLDGA